MTKMSSAFQLALTVTAVMEVFSAVGLPRFVVEDLGPGPS